MKHLLAASAIFWSFSVSAAEPNAYDLCLRDAQERAVNPWQLQNLQNICAMDHPKDVGETLQRLMKSLSDAICKEDPKHYSCKK